MHALIVSHHFLPHVGGLEVLVDYEIRALVAAGHLVGALALAIAVATLAFQCLILCRTGSTVALALKLILRKTRGT